MHTSPQGFCTPEKLGNRNRNGTGFGAAAMGKKSKSKTSRKGKKEWRKNIGTKEVDEYVEKTALADRSGGALEDVPSEALFFVDTTKDTSAVRKVEKHRSKVLHADSILERNSLIPVLKEPGHSNKKRKDRDHAKPLAKPKAAVDVVGSAGKKQRAKSAGFYDVWDAEDGQEGGKPVKSGGLKRDTILASAVEVDMPGCSYNPSFEDHQEALGLAVADEMQKVIDRELKPKSVPIHVDGRALTEEDMFFLDADRDDGEEEDENEEKAGDSMLKSAKYKKLTRADLNRKARRKAVLRVEAAKMKKTKLQKDLQKLPLIVEGIKEEDNEKEIRRIRRTVSREEKRAQGPPRLGRHKFRPEPKQVLLSSEVTGSLRKLKAYPMLMRDRYRSLQRRGIVEPRLPVKRKEKKKWVEIQQGTRGNKEREMHAATLAEKEALKQGLAVLPL